MNRGSPQYGGLLFCVLRMPAYPALKRFCALFFVVSAVSLMLAGCQTASKAKSKSQSGSQFAGLGMSSRECLARAMYFESNRSSNDGMLAVGTVVMNRHESGKYGKSVCDVVGAPRQFAPGVLSRTMTESKSKDRALAVASEVLGGRRHPKVGKAQFFHTAGYEPGYNNMRYVSIEGGNAFYEKVKKGEDTGHLVRIARQGPRDIGDMIAVQETTLVAAKGTAMTLATNEPVIAPPPRSSPVMAAPAPVIADRRDRPSKPRRTAPLPPAVAAAPAPPPAPPPGVYASAAPAGPGYALSTLPPPATLGWNAGPSSLY
jgi:spore germination cell wall hydrolase CwlJ-like protein